MAWQTVMAFWGVSLVFVLTPGADWAHAIAAGIGDRTFMPAVGGMLSGHMAATGVVATGVAALVAGSPSVMTGLTLAGAAYLTWLGVGTLRCPPTPTAASGQAGTSWMQKTVKGFGVSALNPKVFLLFLALLPQFTSVDAKWPVAWQIVALGMAHVVGCAIVYVAVGAGARRILRARPAATRVVGRVSGVAMIGIGVVLVAEQVFH